MLVEEHGPAATTGPLGPTVLGAVACVALAGAIGTGLGATGRRGWTAWILAALSAAAILVVTSEPEWLSNRVVIIAVLLPAFAPIVVMYLWISGFAPAAAVVLLVVAALTLGSAAARIASRAKRKPVDTAGGSAG
jgi:hypothetical protein